jgi:hypothetical protein
MIRLIALLILGTALASCASGTHEAVARSWRRE